jgi:hypothetical protein
MRRWSLRVCVFFLLVCCAAVVVAWVTSYVREDRLVVSRDGTCVQAIASAGQVRVFRFYDYPTPLPWIWEHGEEGRPPGRRIGRPDLWRGQGGTMEFFANERHQGGYGPIRIADGMADSDSLGKAVQARRVPGVPQYISARQRLATTRLAASSVTVNLPNAEIDRLIKSPSGAAQRPLDLGLTRTLTANGVKRGDVTFDIPASDGFTLAPPIKPNSEARRAVAPAALDRAANSGGAGVIGGGGALLVGGSTYMYPRYGYDQVSVPFWSLLFLPLSPLLLLSMVRLRRRHVRRRWKRTGHCVTCGYDLRETVGLCPECGNAK